MAKSIETVEKNVSASFGYVKKDMLMLNDAISDVHDKIQHLSLNQAALLDEMRQLRIKLGTKSVAKPKKVKKVKLVKRPKKKKKVVKKKVKRVKPKSVKRKVKKKKTRAKKSPKKVIKTEEIVYS